MANNLKAVVRPDIKFDVALVESCWAEIDAGEDKKKIIIGCIYKHPTCNLEQFRNQLRACLHGGWGPQVGEVTCQGGVTRLPI